MKTLEELVAEHTNEAGEIDWSAIEEANKAEITKQVGASVSKANKKNAAELEALKGANNAATEKNGTLEEQVAKLLQRMDEADKAAAAKTLQGKFEEQAKTLNVDPNLVKTFIDSGADLSKIDLEAYKGAAVKKLDPHDNHEDKGGKKQEDDAAAQKAALEKALAARV